MLDASGAIYRVNRTIAVCLIILTAFAILAVLHFGKPFLAPTLVGLLIALTLSPLARFLECRGLRRELAAAAVLLGGIAALAFGVWALSPSYDEWRMRAPEIAEKLKERFAEMGETLEEVSQTAEAVQDAAQQAAGMKDDAAAPSPPPAAPGGGQILLRWLAEAPAAAATLLYVTLLVFFVIAERAQLHRALLAITPSTRRRVHLARTLRDMRRSVSRYLLTITVINVGLGMVTALTLYLLGVPNAALWGAAMAVLNYVPYLGAALMNGVILVVGLVSFDSLTFALLPMGAILLLNLIEGQIVTPMIVGRRILESSLAVFVAVAFGAWLWGAVGALIATPMLIIVRIGFKRFQLLPKSSLRRQRLVSPQAERREAEVQAGAAERGEKGAGAPLSGAPVSADAAPR